MKKEELEYINRKIKNANYMGYDRVSELLELIKKALINDSKKDMIFALWVLIDYITFY